MTNETNNPQQAEQVQGSAARRLIRSLLLYVLPAKKTEQPQAPVAPAAQQIVIPESIGQLPQPAQPKRRAVARKHKTTKHVAHKHRVIKKKHNKRRSHVATPQHPIPPAHQRAGVVSAAERHQARLTPQAPFSVSDTDKHGLLDMEFIDIASPLPSPSLPLSSLEQESSITNAPITKTQVAQEMQVEFTDADAKQSAVDENALREQVQAEGFLESVQPEEKKLAAADMAKRVAIVEEQQAQDPKALKKQIKEKAKREREEEKRWQKEADLREKQAKKEEAKPVVAETKDAKAPLKYKMPEVKKRGPLKVIADSLGNMGLDKERIAFIDNLATMMDAGLPLLDALRVLQKEARKGPMRKILGRILVAVEMGSPLWRAMEGQYFFKQQQVAMIRVGEESGSLAENLQYLAEQEEKDRTLKGKVKTAMIYPTIVLVMLTVIVFGLGLFVLPQLVQVIISLGVPLPFVTRVIIGFTNVFTTHTQTILLSFLGGVITFILLTKYTPFKIVVEWCLYHIPGIGTLIIEATLSRFGVVMGGLLRAGVPITEALDSLAKATSLTRYQSFYERLLEQVQLGDAFATSFEKIKTTDKCFPVSMQQLIVTGEQSGSLTKIMFKIAQIHEKRAADVAEKLPVIIEPMLLLFIGGLVATIALGVLAPIYSVVGNIGG
jgi:type IV pilus assembly protein PilC